MFDVLIIGGGVAGISCALVIGSAHSKPFVQNKKTGILLHQKSSDLQDAVFNNAYGIPQELWVQNYSILLQIIWPQNTLM